MKIRKLLFNAFLAVGSILLVVSCSETISQVEDSLTTASNEKSTEIAPAPGDSCTFSGDLTDAEIAGLMEMREEEKLAHDVYSFFFETYDYVIFDNISKSESAHTDAVLYLISGYGLEDPTTDEEGVFINPMFSELFASLTEQGSASLVEALKVGAFIEESDINDLQNHIKGTQNEDVIRVYSNLLHGSESHLRAFSNILTQLGGIYEPQVIPTEEYEAILAGGNSNGNRNKNGYGNGGGSTSSGNGTGRQNGKNDTPTGNQNQNNSSSGSGECDGTGPNF